MLPSAPVIPPSLSEPNETLVRFARTLLLVSVQWRPPSSVLKMLPRSPTIQPRLWLVNATAHSSCGNCAHCTLKGRARSKAGNRHVDPLLLQAFKESTAITVTTDGRQYMKRLVGRGEADTCRQDTEAITCRTSV